MTEKNSDYYELQKELYKSYKRKKIYLIFLLFSVGFGVLALIYSVPENIPTLDKIIIVLLIIFFVFFVLILSNLIYVNISQSDYEEKLVKKGIEYLYKENLSKARVDIIGKRAEIGNNALSGRTTLPILLIPLLITYFSGKISSETQSLIALAILLISLSFVLELDKANMDVIIRQICVSYAPLKETKKKNETNKKTKNKKK